MALEIVKLTLGPVQTNTYIVTEQGNPNAVVIDPAWDGHLILEQLQQRGWRTAAIWLTHAHFDHFGGAAALADGTPTPPQVALHPADYVLWRAGGGARNYGLSFDPGPEPTIDLAGGQTLYIGKTALEVRFAPGHSRGSVMFYCAAEQLMFCGDVIFQMSIGRTDLPGADHQTLLDSIAREVLPLPDAVRLLPGHGPETTVGQEREYNPFLQD
ncbi:MAG: MBL fold metallo-hydrolase [Anaerolineales bacterium]|nr:MBL fold metallo-hydrolase [Anaerolineales bacterium]MCW5888562.1 MBL fold metallo-hydrolase [Anaerolineales bacterium]